MAGQVSLKHKLLHPVSIMTDEMLLEYRAKFHESGEKYRLVEEILQLRKFIASQARGKKPLAPRRIDHD